MSVFRSAAAGVSAVQHSAPSHLDNCYRDYGVRNAKAMMDLLTAG